MMTPSDFSPSVTSTMSSSDSSRTMTTSGVSMLLWISMGSSLIRVNALIGALCHHLGGRDRALACARVPTDLRQLHGRPLST
jgi:hypothetical protein